jgi:hypothetical protein
VRESGAVGGVDASLTGEFLDLVWAGPSYVVDGEGNRIAASERAVGTEITVVRLVRDHGSWSIDTPDKESQAVRNSIGSP